MRTSHGQLQGTISYPDTITALTLSEYDTLQIGQSLTVSWPGSEADFYYISLSYSWRDDDSNWRYTYIDTFAAGHSITFPGSIFSYNGEIYWIRVQAMSGPLPAAGSAGNMSGDGSGFLYYYGQSVYHNTWIIVGSGSNGYLVEMTSERPNKREIQAAIRRKIENLILGH